MREDIGKLSCPKDVAGLVSPRSMLSSELILCCACDWATKLLEGDAVTLPPLVKSAAMDFRIESFDFGDMLLEVRMCCARLPIVDASPTGRPE